MSPLSGVTFTRDDARVASCSESGMVLLHSVMSSKVLGTFHMRDMGVGSPEVRGRAVPTPSGVPLDLQRGSPQPCTSLQFGPIRTALLAVTGDNGSVRIWDTATQDVFADFPVRGAPGRACLPTTAHARSAQGRHLGSAMAVAWSPVSGALLCSGGLDKQVAFMDALQKRCARWRVA